MTHVLIVKPTDLRARGSEPIDAGRRQCGICSRDSTLWCGYTDEPEPHRTQTTTTTNNYTIETNTTRPLDWHPVTRLLLLL